MKKMILITGTILIACVIIGSLAAQPAAQTTRAEAASQISTVGYVVKESEGRVAVFIQGEEQPLMITETYLNTLPKTDAEKLKKGVFATDKKQLRKLLEDYCS